MPVMAPGSALLPPVVEKDEKRHRAAFVEVVNINLGLQLRRPEAEADRPAQQAAALVNAGEFAPHQPGMLGGKRLVERRSLGGDERGY